MYISFKQTFSKNNEQKKMQFLKKEKNLISQNFKKKFIYEISENIGKNTKFKRNWLK